MLRYYVLSVDLITLVMSFVYICLGQSGLSQATGQ